MTECWHCGKPLENPPGGKVSFRATCDKCHSWLHCCKNCKHYKPGQPNDCLVPGTEPISDREKNNYCEEFEQGSTQQKKKVDLDDVAKRLFKD